ncbi:hypothetical protein CLV62_10481 [Dysgonomonas alginatilytica]|uniref:PIN domain-containing protein n=1 Tax=Dysgonomonas alginatilytica TaxID=1605892 RepID=A0A2V3PTG5_9BACT|nr:hypothetical protein [Dysgonomonas alginatilytica]PXV66821.1 hypothetical protein CLV62_10481 [Dysgonomonas alginatilytica]
MSKYVYLDWNIFNKIEHIDSLEEEEQIVFSKIEDFILKGEIICPYSNAHINDLIRGYRNNPNFINGHISTLQRLTNNLSIVQYWGHEKVTWHYRDVKDFFGSALDENSLLADSYSELCSWDDTGLWNAQLNLMKSIEIPSSFKNVYKANSIFNVMFPKTKIYMNMLALCEDIYHFSNNAKKDFTIYKSLKKYINQARSNLKQQQKMLREVDKSISTTPLYLEFDNILEPYLPKTKTSKNEDYQKITDTYFKLDLKGFKSDDKFSNLLDDALHVFYGAQCDYFITIDDKCHYKATETYQKLGIPTLGLKPKEFITAFLE